mmetsp:Transcript_120808/g.240669  ORF Transcript_120808/g.240669 Transcript_120808/m.240669 type:complete len:351 (-) Transcript_120808:665-1717(-)
MDHLWRFVLCVRQPFYDMRPLIILFLLWNAHSLFCNLLAKLPLGCYSLRLHRYMFTNAGLKLCLLHLLPLPLLALCSHLLFELSCQLAILLTALLCFKSLCLAYDMSTNAGIKFRFLHLLPAALFTPRLPMHFEILGKLLFPLLALLVCIYHLCLPHHLCMNASLELSLLNFFPLVLLLLLGHLCFELSCPVLLLLFVLPLPELPEILHPLHLLKSNIPRLSFEFCVLLFCLPQTLLLLLHLRIEHRQQLSLLLPLPLDLAHPHLTQRCCTLRPSNPNAVRKMVVLWRQRNGPSMDNSKSSMLLNACSIQPPSSFFCRIVLGAFANYACCWKSFWHKPKWQHIDICTRTN